ncbi:MAG: endolytic transglycosylase MltG [Sphingobacteriales bacterium]|nr:endolytic transglycosylase MltG [Sphingobacteriales bacterium]
MKRRIIPGVLLILILAASFTGYKVFGPAVSDSTGKYFYIRTGENMDTLSAHLVADTFISNNTWFKRVAGWLNFKKVKPGRYELKNGMSLYKLVRVLRAGEQKPVKMVIVKERTRENFAGKMGKKFDTECDSLRMIRFLNSKDSLQPYGLDTNTVMSVILPFTYEIKWNSTPGKMIEQFQVSFKKFWNAERTQKAARLNLTPLQATILASIVEEETTRKADKYNIASTYLNRLKIRMKLQACPTAKFVSRDFQLGRITEKQTSLVSPYNTYLNEGLPPGPICTPSIESIEAVLDAPSTGYLYFVASDKFDGSTVFTSNYEDHMKYARLFQAEQKRRSDSLKKIRGK